jgi:hypothetical protein
VRGVHSEAKKFAAEAQILLAPGEKVCILQKRTRYEARLREHSQQEVESTEIEHALPARQFPR